MKNDLNSQSNKILVCGSFGNGRPICNGQQIRTTTIYNTLKKEYGEDNVLQHDTASGIKSFFVLLFKLPKYYRQCKNIVILPAHNGIRLIVPLFIVTNWLYRRKIHYVAIGGWLPDFLSNKPLLRRFLTKLSGIYVQTAEMIERLTNMGYNSVYWLPNFKELTKLEPSDLKYDFDSFYPLCTFSRVSKDKGIEDAIEAVRQLNVKYGKQLFSLDIFGKVDSDQKEWFENLLKTIPPYVSYKGEIAFDKSTEALKDHFALLFPTYYPGEGFAGTIVDAMAAGLPVIASDWRYNPEFVNDNHTGFIFKTHDVNELASKIDCLYSNHELYRNMRKEALEESQKYKPQEVIKRLTCNFG